MKQVVFLTIIIVAVLGGGYLMYQLFMGAPVVDQFSVPAGIDEDKLAEYRKIQTLKPDLSIFTDSFFKSLFSPFQVFSSGTTTAGKIGRVNPFTPF